MNCRVNIVAVASGDIGISYCQEVSTAGRKHRHSVSVNTGWGLKQLHRKRLPYGSLFSYKNSFFLQSGIIRVWTGAFFLVFEKITVCGPAGTTGVEILNLAKFLSIIPANMVGIFFVKRIEFFL